MNFDQLVSSQKSYKKYIDSTLDNLKQDDDLEVTLKKIVLFCKHILSIITGSKLKKKFCLLLLKDISCSIDLTPTFFNILDQNIPAKLLKLIKNEIANKNDHSNVEESDQLINLILQTIQYWRNKQTNQNTQFNEVWFELKKINIDMPKVMKYYNINKISLDEWGKQELKIPLKLIDKNIVDKKKLHQIFFQLQKQFNQLKNIIQDKLNDSIKNQEQIFLKEIIYKLKNFLLIFYLNYKLIQLQNCSETSIFIIQYHIANNIYKQICDRIYISSQQLILITKQCFQEEYSSELCSIDRMEMINIAVIQKYNILNIFQKIQRKIEQEQKKLPTYHLAHEIIKKYQIKEKQHSMKKSENKFYRSVFNFKQN